jgi:hypothetical protein
VNSNISTFLPPIEDPEDKNIQAAHDMSHQQFGKVLTPLKVAYARMPYEFREFSARISELDKKMILPPETAMLIREKVAHINVFILHGYCSLGHN